MNTNTPPPHVIIFVPGYLGSKLMDPVTKKVIWLDLAPKNWNVRKLIEMFGALRYPSNLQPNGLYEGILFAPPLIKRHPHTNFRNLLTMLGYRCNQQLSLAERDYFEFCYDWRQDNRISARQLGAFVDEVKYCHKDKEIWLVAHSNGGLVTRWYIEQEGGKQHIQRQFLVGAPWDGTPKAIRVIFSGLDFIMRPILGQTNFAEASRDLCLTFPSIYQLIPFEDIYLRDEFDNPINVLDAKAWLPQANFERYSEYLQDAYQFAKVLGNTLSVPTTCIFGNEKNTVTSGTVKSMALGRWQSIKWDENTKGDGTIPLKSAIYPNAQEKYPIHALHGELCIHDHVLAILKWELRDRYLGVTRSALVKPDLTVQIKLNRDAYAPNEVVSILIEIQKQRDVNDSQTSSPVTQAVVSFSLLALDIFQKNQSSKTRTPASMVTGITSRAIHVEAGSYLAKVQMPADPGYYELNVEIERELKLTEHAREMILVNFSSTPPD